MQLSSTVRRHGDLLVAVALATGYTLELLSYENANHAIAIPLAIGAGLTLAIRRRAPFATFLIVIFLNTGVLHWAPGFDESSAAFVVIFLFNLYSLGANARGVESWLGVVGVLATVVAFVVGDGDPNPSSVLFAVAFCGTPWAAGVVVRLRGDRERELRAMNVALQEENARAIATERARIARELHDVVSHAIAVTVLQARGGRKMVGRDDDAVQRALSAIEQTNTSALADMRRLLALLRDADEDPERPEPQPSLERLDRLVEQVRGSGLPVDLEVTGEPLPIPPGLDLSAYRIVQEALTNVLKHAGPGASARVSSTTARRTSRSRSPTVEGTAPPVPMVGMAWSGSGSGSPWRAARWRSDPPAAATPYGSSALPPGDLVIRVVLADDQPLVRTGLRMILSDQADLEVVGEAATGVQAVEVCAETGTDVVLMDVRMPELDGIDATRAVTAVDDPPRVLVLTTFDLDDVVYEALRAGASGFLLKDAPEERLTTAIRVVADGGSLFAPSVTRRLIEEFSRRTAAGPPPDLGALTERETEVLTQVARGLSNAEIAATLFVSENTVKTHVARMLMKLGLRDRVQAVVLAYESGLVRPNS